MAFKQARDPIHFKHKSLQGAGFRCKQMNNPIPILLMIHIFKHVLLDFWEANETNFPYY